jgi:hypothetical protein
MRAASLLRAASAPKPGRPTGPARNHRADARTTARGHRGCTQPNTPTSVGPRCRATSRRCPPHDVRIRRCAPENVGSRFLPLLQISLFDQRLAVRTAGRDAAPFSAGCRSGCRFGAVSAVVGERLRTLPRSCAQDQPPQRPARRCCRMCADHRRTGRAGYGIASSELAPQERLGTLRPKPDPRARRPTRPFCSPRMRVGPRPPRPAASCKWNSDALHRHRWGGRSVLNGFERQAVSAVGSARNRSWRPRRLDCRRTRAPDRERTMASYR